MKKRVILIVVSVVLASMIGYRLYANKKHIDQQKSEVKTPDFKIPVKVWDVKEMELSFNLVKTGNAAPFQEADIMVSAPGQVVQVKFDLGTRVSEGQVIGKTDTKLKELSLQQAELSLKKLEKDLKRIEDLYKGGGATEVNLTDITFNYENTKIQVEQLKQQIADAQIKAPVSGIVVMKNIEPGEYANPGTPLGSVVDVSKLKISVKVSENEVYSLAEGQSVKVMSPVFKGESREGKIHFISPKGDQLHNYYVEIHFPNPSGVLKAGSIVYIDFSKESVEKALQIPRTSIVESVKNPTVYVLENGVAKLRNITVGRESGDYVEVKSGLKAGDKVVVSGQINLSDNTPVEIAVENTKQ